MRNVHSHKDTLQCVYNTESYDGNTSDWRDCALADATFKCRQLCHTATDTQTSHLEKHPESNDDRREEGRKARKERVGRKEGNNKERWSKKVKEGVKENSCRDHQTLQEVTEALFFLVYHFTYLSWDSLQHKFPSFAKTWRPLHSVFMSYIFQLWAGRNPLKRFKIEGCFGIWWSMWKWWQNSHICPSSRWDLILAITQPRKHTPLNSTSTGNDTCYSSVSITNHSFSFCNMQTHISTIKL